MTLRPWFDASMDVPEVAAHANRPDGSGDALGEGHRHGDGDGLGWAEGAGGADDGNGAGDGFESGHPDYSENWRGFIAFPYTGQELP